MDKLKLANNLSRIENLIPTAPKKNISDKLVDSKSSEEGFSFKDTFEKLVSEANQGDINLASNSSALVQGQKEVKTQNTPIANNKLNLKFSNHAVERMQSRGISYNPERLMKLDDAIKKAAAKGSKDTLVLMDDSALIVSVKNNTVVTVMDKANLKENVFTNIDSTIVI